MQWAGEDSNWKGMKQGSVCQSVPGGPIAWESESRSAYHSASSWVPKLLNQNPWVWGPGIHNLTGFQWLLMHSNIWELLRQMMKLTLVYEIEPGIEI